MTKSEFVSAVADESGLTKKDALAAIDAFTTTVTKVLLKHDRLSLIGFGTFLTSPRAARTARVPGTDRTVPVAATVVAKFKVGKNLKDSLAATVSSCKAKKKCKKK